MVVSLSLPLSLAISVQEVCAPIVANNPPIRYYATLSPSDENQEHDQKSR